MGADIVYRHTQAQRTAKQITIKQVRGVEFLNITKYRTSLFAILGGSKASASRGKAEDEPYGKVYFFHTPYCEISYKIRFSFHHLFVDLSYQHRN